jgi:hypothetical protein
MNELAVVDRGADLGRLKALVLYSVQSCKGLTIRALDEFFACYASEPRPGFTKATVAAWRVALEARGLGAVSINVRITAVRKLAVEAADSGLLAPELANGITGAKGVASKGVCLGNWLTRQAGTGAPERAGHHDAPGPAGPCDPRSAFRLWPPALRGAALTLRHIQHRDGRWCIVDVGKHRRIRTVPMPACVKVAINAWTTPAGLATAPYSVP